MPRDVTGPFQADLDSGVTTLCICIKLVRDDGLIQGFTNHDRDLSFDGVTYEASTSFTPSAMESQLGLAVSNLEMMGGIDSDSITEDDLEAGRYDGAEFTVYLVNWLDVTKREIYGLYTWGKVSNGDLAFQVELRSLSQAFAQFIGSLVQPRCRSDLFDTGTGLDGGCNLARPAVFTGTVTAVTSRTTFNVSAVGSFPAGTKGSLSGGYFAEGTVEFTSGLNNGIIKEIMNNTALGTSPVDTLTITTKEPFSLDIAINDTVELQIGCDLTAEVCRRNYDNLVNFRAEPYVPGTDSVFMVNKK